MLLKKYKRLFMLGESKKQNLLTFLAQNGREPREYRVMPSSTPGFQGKRLVQAREARGLSAVNLADLLGVSTTSISQYERGVQSPRPEIMEAISAKLNFVARFLLPVLPQRSGRIDYRSMASATKSARIRAERKSGLRKLSNTLKITLHSRMLIFPILYSDFRKFF